MIKLAQYAVIITLFGLAAYESLREFLGDDKRGKHLVDGTWHNGGCLLARYPEPTGAFTAWCTCSWRHDKTLTVPKD
jgi:hypothetical protein